MIVPCDKWAPAPCDVEVVDIWPPGTLADSARDAYDALARAGRIRPQRVQRDTVGRVSVRYMADIPAPWIHEELREAKLDGRQMQMRME